MEDYRRSPPTTGAAFPSRPWFRLSSQLRLDQQQQSSSPSLPPPRPALSRLATFLPPSPETSPGFARPITAPPPESPKVIRPNTPTPPPSPKPTLHPPPPPAVAVSPLARTDPRPEVEVKPHVRKQNGLTPANYHAEPVPEPEPPAVVREGKPERKVPSSPVQNGSPTPASSKTHVGEAGVEAAGKITLAGDNTGAYMDLAGSNGGRKQVAFTGASRRIGTKEGGEEKAPAPATRPVAAAVVNSNVQGINNSIMFNSSCNHGSPGVHVMLSRSKNGRRPVAVVVPESKSSSGSGVGGRD